MVGIGIDTGGTCTDAVIYDLEEKQILASAKTQTTKEDLKIGIEKVLQGLPQELLGQCRQIALSTTLATNACVENKGGRGKLILLGVNEKVFRETHASYGIQNAADVLLVPCTITQTPENCVEPDWDAFCQKLPEFLESCDCVSIVQLFSADYMGAYEEKAAEIITEQFGLPVILGNTLFPDRNAIRRGSGALLNARLIPVLQEFLTAIKEVFARRGMNLPIAIIRSDGSQMSEKFAASRPVETLLCGPAASVIGAAELSMAPEQGSSGAAEQATDIVQASIELSEHAADTVQCSTEPSGRTPDIVQASPEMTGQMPDTGKCENSISRKENIPGEFNFDAMIVDMGGTTTDIAIIKNGLPKRSENGIRVGAWKTFVKGLYVDTFGLGGDTAIHYDSGGRLYLENYRVIPLCSLASQYPQVGKKLRELDITGRFHTYYLHEFFVLMKDPQTRWPVGQAVSAGQTPSDMQEPAAGQDSSSVQEPASGQAAFSVPNIANVQEPAGGQAVTAGQNMDSMYSDEEYRLCEILREGPLSLEQAAEALGRDIYTMISTETLERDGIIMRAGLTPTDIMHIRGEYTAFSREASGHAAAFVARSARIKTTEDLCGMVYDLIEERLYKNILRILLTSEFPDYYERDPDEQLEALIDINYKMAKNGTAEQAFFAPVFRLRAKLVGVGAPTHVFLPRVAALLRTEAVIPAYAAVANALGAIAGKVIAVVKIEILPYSGEEMSGYEVRAIEGRRVFETYEEALAFAKESGSRTAKARASEQGAGGQITVTYEVSRKEAKVDIGRSMWISDEVVINATGNPAQQA